MINLQTLIRSAPSAFSGGLLFAADVFREFFVSGLSIPFLIGFRLDLALNQELREFSALSFAFERHRV
jgi:hypothetical protein